jgi:hypothetical protein
VGSDSTRWVLAESTTEALQTRSCVEYYAPGWPSLSCIRQRLSFNIGTVSIKLCFQHFETTTLNRNFQLCLSIEEEDS